MQHVGRLGVVAERVGRQLPGRLRRRLRLRGQGLSHPLAVRAEVTHELQHDGAVGGAGGGRGGQQDPQILVDLRAALPVGAERVQIAAGQFRGITGQHHPGHLGVEITEGEIEIRGGGRLGCGLRTDDPDLLLDPREQQAGHHEQGDRGADHQERPQPQPRRGLGTEKTGTDGHAATVMHRRHCPAPPSAVQNCAAGRLSRVSPPFFPPPGTQWTQVRIRRGGRRAAGRRTGRR